MFALAGIAWWHWAVFVAFVLGFLALDLGVFHRRARVIGAREALMWTGLWVGLTLCFAAALAAWKSPQISLEFATSYLIELSLSLDNVAVMAMVFAYFNIPAEHQHRVLFWGLIGALGMRGLLIGVGAVVVSLMHWVLYVLGAVVLFTGVRMMMAGSQTNLEHSRLLRWVRKVYPITPQLEGQRFMIQHQGRRMLTPLAVVLVMVEASDLIFAADSVPAIFAVTTKPFIIFTSNVFALLGLRSLYFLLANALRYFRHLKTGLSLVLVFIGVKMLLDPHEHPPRGIQIDIPISISLAVVGALILASMAFSVFTAQEEEKKGAR